MTNPILDPNAPEPRDRTTWMTTTGTTPRWFVRDDEVTAVAFPAEIVSAGRRWWEFGREMHGENGRPVLTLNEPVTWAELSELADDDAGDFGELKPHGPALRVYLKHEMLAQREETTR